MPLDSRGETTQAVRQLNGWQWIWESSVPRTISHLSGVDEGDTMAFPSTSRLLKDVDAHGGG